MSAAVTSMERSGRDESLGRFVDARDLPPDLQQEDLERFFRASNGELRQRALRAGAAVLEDEALVSYLREDADDVLRNAGLEMLKLRGRRAFSTAVALLADADPDIVLQAVLVLDSLRDPRAWPSLRALLDHDDPNVVQAAITAAGHLAGPSGVCDVVPFLRRDPWLQIAALQALGDMRSSAAVPQIAPLLADPLLQTFAAEALARIGETTAYEVLANYWLTHENEVDARLFVELLATVLTQLDRPPVDEKLRAVAARYARSDDRALAVAAAWCAVTLGPLEDETLLDLLAAAGEVRCPPAIAARRDLVVHLVRRDPPLCDWGYEILSGFPTALAAENVATALRSRLPSRCDALGRYLSQRGDAPLTEVIRALWNERRDERDCLDAAVRRHGPALIETLARHEISPADIGLLCAAGADPAEIAGAISSLTIPERWSAVAEIRSCAVVPKLPWSEWLTSNEREAAVRALAETVSATQCREVMPLLRTELAARPQIELVQAVGDLRDEESVPILAGLLQCGTPRLRSAVFDSLGRIGGTAALAVLRSYCRPDSADWSDACRALASCATELEAPLLRAAADSSDPSVRLAIITPLSSFGDRESVSVLRRLLFDASAVVAQKAQSSLELGRGFS